MAFGVHVPVVVIFGKSCILSSLQSDNHLVLRALSDAGTEGSKGPVFSVCPLSVQSLMFGF